jgi:hypothetical protein
MPHTIFSTANAYPVPLPGRTVQTFPSGLVRVERSFAVPAAQAATYRPLFAVGEPMPFDDGAPAIDGLYIFPEPQEVASGDGFVQFRVTAYGRSSFDGIIEYLPTEGNLLLQGGNDLAEEDEDNPILAGSMELGRNLIFGIPPINDWGRDAKLYRALWNLPVQKMVVPARNLNFTTLASLAGVEDYNLFDNGYLYVSPVVQMPSGSWNYSDQPQSIPLSEIVRMITLGQSQEYNGRTFRIVNAAANAIVRLFLFADKIASSSSFGKFVELTVTYTTFLPLIIVSPKDPSVQLPGNVTIVTR